MLARYIRLVGAVAVLATAPLALAQTQAKRLQPIRAGVVILESARATGVAGGQAISAAPHAWYNLNSNRTVKPASWNIYNPNAAAVLSPEQQARWSQIDPAGTPAAGTRLAKQHAAYWEVFLSQVSETSLADYDVLLVNPANFAGLTPGERERLRRFVDQGGLLWIDAGALRQGANGIDLINNFPYAFVLAAGPATGTERADFTQPLLSSPHPLSTLEVSLLNTSIDPTFQTNMWLSAVNLNANAGLQTTVGSVSAEFLRLQPAILLNNRPTMSIGRIGDGVIVITSRGASLKLNRPYGSTMIENSLFMAKSPELDRDGLAAAKLAVNMISMMTEFRQGNGGSRKTGSSPIDASAPLLRRSSTAGAVDSAPTIYKGMVVAVLGNRIVAYDADPSRDLDSNGNPDDGLTDLALGTNEDVVWMSAPLANVPLSTPVCVEVPDALGGIPKDQVLVVDAQGTLHAYDMMVRINGEFPYGTGTTLDDARGTSYSCAPSATPTTTGVPASPTVHEGLAYVADNTSGGVGGVRGRVWVVNLSSGAIMETAGRQWIMGGGAPSPISIPELTSSVTVGNIPIADNSGGVDRVLYGPFAPNSAGVPSAGFIGLWLGAKGERPTDYEPKPGDTGTALIVTTRASSQGGLPIYLPGAPSPWGVKLTLLDNNGLPLPITRMAAIFAATGPTDLGGGVLSFPFRPGRTSLPNDVAGVRIDYTIDLGSAIPGVLAAIERGRVNLPDSSSVGARRVMGPVVLSPGGTIWVTCQRPGNGGQANNRGGIYSFREEGRGLYRMTTRYELYKEHTIPRNGGELVQYPETFFDNDPLRLMVYERSGGAVRFGGRLTNYRIAGPPVVRNGQVFVVAAASEAATVPVFGSVPLESTIVMAFRAEAEVPQFRIGDMPGGTVLLQRDVARSQNLDVPEQVSTLAGANYSYDGRSGRLRFENLATVQKGVIQNSLSLSQPIIVRRPGMPDELIEPDRLPGATWSPLLWFSVIQGFDVTGSVSPLVATGDTLFVAGRSRTPRFLTGTGFAPVGMLYAIRTDVSSGNPYLSALDPNSDSSTRPAMMKLWPPSAMNRPWMSQFGQLRLVQNDTTNPGNSSFDANPGFLWPQLRGMNSIEEFIVRLNQATLSGSASTSQTARGVVAGDGAVIAWGDAGMYTYSRSDFLVVDEGRVSNIDPAGNVIETTTAIGGGSAVGSNSGSIRPLVKPTRAYRRGNGGMAIVDTGGNRISVLDSLGNETRSLAGFVLDPNHVPTGYSANDPLTFNSPRDVLMFTSYKQRPSIDSVVTAGDGVGPNAYEFWVHYVVADSGNRRLIEVVDRYRYNATTGLVGAPVTIGGVAQMGVLTWHSPANVSGKDFGYNSISRSWLGPEVGGRWVYVAGIGGGLPTRVGVGLDSPASGGTIDSRDGNGGIAIFDPGNPNGSQVINKVALPAFAANVFWNDSTASFNSAARNATTKFLGNVSSVTTRALPSGTGTGAIAIMIADGSGVYEVVYDGSTNTETLPVRWLLPNDAYRALRRLGAGAPTGSNVPLRASFARRLDNGDVLIVNSYYGKRRDGVNIGGEVLQLNGTLNAPAVVSAPNLGFNLLSITYELPPIEGSRGLVLPVFADRK